MGLCHLDEFSSGCWSGASQTTEKVTATRSLSISTSWPLYQGTRKTEEPSQEESFAKRNAKSLACGAQGRGLDPRGSKLEKNASLLVPALALSSDREARPSFIIERYREKSEEWKKLLLVISRLMFKILEKFFDRELDCSAGWLSYCPKKP